MWQRRASTHQQDGTEREAMFDAFRQLGLDEITVLRDERDHPNGPAMSFTASRQWFESFIRMTTPL